MRVLIIEDEKDLSRSIATYLRRENYICDTADTIVAGLKKIAASDYDCIVVDASLPDGNGLYILRNLPAGGRDCGVIVISARDSVDDRVQGLNLGADDFLVRPFSLSELYARIGSIIRRKRFQGQNLIVVNELEINLATKIITVHKQNVELTRREFDLLLYLISNRNRVLSRHAIAEHISTDNCSFPESVDVVYSHIKNLKRKLAGAGCSEYIKSVYGMGYRFFDGPHGQE